MAEIPEHLTNVRFRGLTAALPAGKNPSVLVPIDRELLHCMSLLLAQSGHSTTQFRCPLSGVKQTLRKRPLMSAFDPKRTLAFQNCCDARSSLNPISQIVDSCLNRVSYDESTTTVSSLPMSISRTSPSGDRRQSY